MNTDMLNQKLESIIFPTAIFSFFSMTFLIHALPALLYFSLLYFYLMTLWKHKEKVAQLLFLLTVRQLSKLFYSILTH